MKSSKFSAKLSLRKNVNPAQMSKCGAESAAASAYKHKVEQWGNISEPGMDYNPNDVMKIMI